VKIEQLIIRNMSNFDKIQHRDSYNVNVHIYCD